MKYNFPCFFHLPHFFRRIDLSLFCTIKWNGGKEKKLVSKRFVLWFFVTEKNEKKNYLSQEWSRINVCCDFWLRVGWTPNSSKRVHYGIQFIAWNFIRLTWLKWLAIWICCCFCWPREWEGKRKQQWNWRKRAMSRFHQFDKTHSLTTWFFVLFYQRTLIHWPRFTAQIKFIVFNLIQFNLGYFWGRYQSFSYS